ncbi:hypothetical protein D9757_011511 [Collybiopsis confluens]|uniref:Protein kinase domain-containing protein n=1 Tax=Collybiopsis confluens TaxID=2823264 RepID=A0A8H5H7B5_9AGAR|nr:hypothetical protein D9757_011511 [Collybiopsis confluens]
MYPYQTNDELGSNPDITQLLLRVLHEYETVIASQGSISSTSQEIFQWMDILEAQRLLDHLQLVLDRAEMIDEGSNHTIFLKMLRFLSRKFDILPTSLTLPDVSRHGNNSVAGGGFADIWHGSIGMVESLVCIKVLRLNIEQDENQRALIRKEFLHEALIWRQLKHPNVLPLLGVSSELFFPSFCLISPWMANSNVVSYLRRNPQHSFSQTAISRYCCRLDYLHTRSPPIIHGDIRGANILVNASGHCCLADFGLSVITTTSEAWSSATTSAMKGAIRWMAPEYVRQDGSTDTLSNHTPRDVYAFGCTIIEILTGKMPFYDRKTDVAVLLSLISGERPARPRDIWYPETVWEIATSCWAEDGQSRLNAATIYDRFKLMRTDPINSFMNFQHSPRKFDAFKWNHILNMTAEQELLRWFDLGW